MEIKWPKGKDFCKLSKEVKANLTGILRGKVLVIDPASRSLGYSVILNGTIQESGLIEVPPKAPIIQRLKYLSQVLQEDGRYDILVIERIRGRMAHEYLKWSIGAIIASVDADVLIEMPINCWKAVAGKGYIKSDDGDAEMIAKTTLLLAKECQ